MVNRLDKHITNIYKLLPNNKLSFTSTYGNHLGKRERYRFLKKPLSPNYKIDGLYIDVAYVKGVLNHLPDSVFEDSLVSKMRDDLALKLYEP